VRKSTYPVHAALITTMPDRSSDELQTEVEDIPEAITVVTRARRVASNEILISGAINLHGSSHRCWRPSSPKCWPTTDDAYRAVGTRSSGWRRQRRTVGLPGGRAMRRNQAHTLHPRGPRASRQRWAALHELALRSSVDPRGATRRGEAPARSRCLARVSRRRAGGRRARERAAMCR
jgi:hypothetical protein